MNSLHKHLLAAGLVAALGTTAIAQTPSSQAATDPAVAHRGMGMMDPAKRQEMRQLRAERMLAAVKLKLQINSAQEGAWNSWATAMKPGAPRQRLDRAEFERLTTPERIDRMRAQRVVRIAEMDRLADATKTFYAALNADQQKVFDGESLHFMQRGGKGMRGDHHGGHHRG